jgi:hypothetical protein
MTAFVGIYVRDSHHAATQIARLKEKAASKGWGCTAVYHDRDGRMLDECLKAAFRASLFEILLVPRLTHLRHGPSSFVDLSNGLEQVGVQVIALKPPFGFTEVRGDITYHPAIVDLREACKAEPWSWR